MVVLSVLLVGAVPRPAGAREADPWTGPDKSAHLAAGLLLSGASYALWAERRDGRGWGALLGVGVGLGAGAGKELADLAGLGHPSAKDFAWTALGTVLGVGLALLIDVAARGTGAPRHQQR
jgi:uncharacterized protein YfiM (DUF2279 family)